MQIDRVSCLIAESKSFSLRYLLEVPQQEKLEEKKRGDVNQLSTHNSCCSKKKTYYFGVCDVGPRLEQ